VEGTLEAIQERLSPGQIFDQAVAYLRSSGGNEFLHNFGATVRDNPVPVALLGTGLAWLMLSRPRPRRPYYEDEDLLSEYPEDYYGTGDYPAGFYPGGDYPAEDDEDVVFGDRPSVTEEGQSASPGPGFAERAKETAEAARRKAQELREGGEATAHELSEDARETAQEWGAGARAAAWRARERARRLRADTGEYLRDSARGARARAGRYGRRMRRGFLDTLHEQPLVLGAVGLAVGAAIGAGLPATQTEDEWMGETRDRLRNRAERAGRDQVAKARAAARAAYEAALDEADRQGLTPEAAVAATELRFGHSLWR
jgi:hypothetical protein